MAKSKDITALLAQINLAISPSAGVGGINATSHNAALIQLVSDLGWMGNFMYWIGNSDGEIVDNTVELGSQNYNDSTPMIRISKLDMFFVDNSAVLDLMVKKSVIVLRDIDGDVATWKVSSVVKGNSSGVDYYNFTTEAASTNSDKTLGLLVQKIAGIQLIPYIGDRIDLQLNLVITDANNEFTFDFSKYDSFRFEFDSISTAGATVMTPINIVEGQSGFISFEMAGQNPIGAVSQFNWLTPWMNVGTWGILDTQYIVYYEYRIVKGKIWMHTRWGLV